MRDLRRFLAGMMAMTMVAGCSSTGRSTSPHSGDEVEVVTTAGADPTDSTDTTDSEPGAGPTVGPSNGSTAGGTAPASTGGTVDTGPTPLPASAILQAPPATLALVGTPHEQAVLLADALGSPDADRASALLAAFGAAGLAVVDENEQSLTTTGGLGMPWVFVSNVSTATNADARIALSEVVRVLGADGIEPRLDDAAVAADLVDGLRAALAADPSVAGPTMIALLVQEEARRATGADLADPAVTADQIEVSMPTAALLVSAGLLSSIGQYASAVALPSSRVASPARPAALLAAGCATDPEGQWALWVLSKLLAGADLPGVSWTGLFDTVISHAVNAYPGGAPPGLSQLKAQYGKVATAAGYLAAALTAASAIAATLTLKADVRLKPGEPLVRTKKSTQDGNTGTIAVTVSFDYGKVATSRINAINCLLSALVSVGNNSTLPVPGPVSGVTVTIEGLEGFGSGIDTDGSYVVLNTPLQTGTNDAGQAEFSVMGRHQRVDIPETAPPYDRWFTVSIEAPADPTDGSGLAKYFFDSFLCAGGALAGKIAACVDPIADVWRMTNFDLGVRRFRLVDWAQDYRVDGLNDGLHFQATKCAGIAGTWEFTVDTTTNNYHPNTTLSIVVDRDPVPGGSPVSVISGPLRYYDSLVKTSYEENYTFDFYADGADSPAGGTPGLPALVIDKGFGGPALPIQVGNFC